MLKARRTAAAALVLGVGALTLTGCFVTPPALPTAPSIPPVSQAPTDPGTTPAPSTPTEPSASADPSPAASDAPATPDDGQSFTVDDGLGDIWSFNVTQVIGDPPMESGSAADGTHLVGVVIDAEHVEGDVSFRGSFDIFVKGDDGETYDWRDTIELTAENDVFYADAAGFTNAVAAVQLPEGVEPAQVILRSAYGYPEVADTVFDIQP